MYILEVSYGCPSEKYPQNGIFQFDQAKALAEYGHKVVFAAVDIRSIRRWRRWGISSHSKSGIPALEFNFPIGPILPAVSNKIASIGFSRLLKKVISKYGRPDLVHVHFGETAQYVVDACRRENIPYVVTEHSSAVNRDEIPKEYADMLRYTYSNAAGVIAVSSKLAERIKTHCGIDAEVVPNIVSIGGTPANSIEDRDERPFRYISAGFLNNRKGFDLLLPAFRKLLSQFPESRLTIMGDGPERDALAALSKELSIEDKISLTGAYVRGEFREKLEQSDAFVLASRVETFGVVCIEALACGVPVIATRSGGPEDFLNEKNGLLVPVENVDALTDAMADIQKNIKAYDKKEIAAQTECRFSPPMIAKELTECFNIVLSDKCRYKDEQ